MPLGFPWVPVLKGVPMKLENSLNNHSTNQPNQSYDFQIGDSSVIIEILRHKIYKNPIRTLVQEYICNARDACREAKKEDHLLTITAPTKDNPVFSVRDFGCGISPERMEKVFVMYGASTKRDNNQQTGGFGIGAKSAWAYTDSFNIITRIQGKKRFYCAHVGAKNQGTLEFVSETDTTEDDGTEIIIGVKVSDIERFQLAIQRCVYFWYERPKILGLQKLEWFSAEPIFDSQTGIRLMPESEQDYLLWQSRIPLIIVDGIPYESNWYLEQTIKNARLCVDCKTGDVEVQASRENLSDSASNQEKIKKMIEDSCESLIEISRRQILGSQDINTYIKNVCFWHRIMNRREDFEAFGLKINKNGYINQEELTHYRWVQVERNLKKTFKFESNVKAHIEDLYKATVFIIDEDMSRTRLMARVKHELSTRKSNIGIGIKNYTDTHLGLRHIKISEIKLPKNQKAPRSPATKLYNFKLFDGYNFRDHLETTSNLVNDTENYVYVDLKDPSLSTFKSNSLYNLCKMLNRKIIGVGVQTKSVIEKLKKEKPRKFYSYDDLVKNMRKDLSKNDFNILVSYTKSYLLSEVEELRSLNNFLRLKGFTENIGLIRDSMLRVQLMIAQDNFNKFYPNHRGCAYPKEIFDLIIKENPSMISEVSKFRELAIFIENKIPFFTGSGYDWTETQTIALIKALDCLVREGE
jgi:hypothetical protein